MSYQPGELRQRIVAFDYDGTLHPNVWPGHGEPYPHMVQLVEKLKAANVRVCVNTARASLDVPAIVDNLDGLIPEVHAGKPIADLYLDDRGLLPPAALVDAFVDLYFDGAETFVRRLAAGELDNDYADNITNDTTNPAHVVRHDDTFRIVVPVTGGMDSTTLWQMAVESGMPVWPVYLDMGQEYAAAEIAVAAKIVADSGHTLTVISVPVSFVRHDFLMLGRNAVIIFTLAELMRERGFWGELWFGNYGSESPVLGGDKSRRFFADTQALLSLRNYDVRICNPLIGMDKVDEVAYWRSRDIDVLINTKSCFSAEAGQCGGCQPCFKKWVAFMEHGIDIRDTFARRDIRAGFDGFIRKYKERMGLARAQGDHSHYSPARIESTLRAIDSLEREP